MTKSTKSALRAQRELRGMTQEALAEKTGMSVRQLRRFENGEQQVTGARAAELATALNISIETVLGIGSLNLFEGQYASPFILKEVAIRYLERTLHGTARYDLREYQARWIRFDAVMQFNDTFRPVLVALVDEQDTPLTASRDTIEFLDIMSRVAPQWLRDRPIVVLVERSASSTGTSFFPESFRDIATHRFDESQHETELVWLTIDDLRGLALS